MSSRLMRIGRSSRRPQPLVTTARARSLRTSCPVALSTSYPTTASRRSDSTTRVTPGRRPNTAAASAPGADLQVHRLGPAEPCGEIGGRVNRHDAPFVDDDDAVAGLRDFRKDVRAEDDRVVAGELLDELARLDDLFGIEAGRRFIQDEHVRIVNDRLRQPDPLAVALRQLGAQTVGHVGDARARHHRADALLPVCRKHALQFADEVQILHDGHVGVEGRRFREVPGPALGLDRLFEHIESRDDRLALRGRHEPGQDAHRRRLAGAVGPQEAEDLAAFHPEADVFDGRDAAVAFREVLNLDHFTGSCSLYPSQGRARVTRPTRPWQHSPDRRARSAGRQPKMLTESRENGQVVTKR